MKQIIANRYLRSFRFSSSNEAAFFLSNQNGIRILTFDDSHGEYYYCYVCYHSLTMEKQFVLSFSSYQNEEHLNFLFWDSTLVLDTGTMVYLLDEELIIKASIEIPVCLIGLFLVSSDRLLVLEEVSFKIIDNMGNILKSEFLDLIEGFSIKDNVLFIQTSEGNKVFELT